MDLQLSGKRALVTGGSRGLGRAIAEALHKEGAQIAICARNEARLAEASKALGVRGYVADLGRPESCEELVSSFISDFGGIDVLVLNTGGPPAGDFADVSEEQWRHSFENLWIGTVRLLKAALPSMRSQGSGRIILVTSISAREPLPRLAISNALRPGLHGLVNSLSREEAAHGITVNALMPGYTLTERLVDLGVDEEAVAASIPARRMGRAEEFAALAAFIASGQAAYITGQAIACDGGLSHAI